MDSAVWYLLVYWDILHIPFIFFQVEDHPCPVPSTKYATMIWVMFAPECRTWASCKSENRMWEGHRPVCWKRTWEDAWLFCSPFLMWSQCEKLIFFGFIKCGFWSLDCNLQERPFPSWFAFLWLQGTENTSFSLQLAMFSFSFYSIHSSIHSTHNYWANLAI